MPQFRHGQTQCASRNDVRTTCWHRVPGGTAVATLELARALVRLDGLELIGVAARHAHEPAATWRPPVQVTRLPLPRLALYEAWHRLRRPAVERWTGSIDLIHATAMPIPPRSAPLVSDGARSCVPEGRRLTSPGAATRSLGEDSSLR